jgi:hypothetical protein
MTHTGRQAQIAFAQIHPTGQPLSSIRPLLANLRETVNPWHEGPDF